MSWRRLGILVLFADFLVFTAWVIYRDGYMVFADVFLGSAAGVQVLIDLTISLALVATWMIRDARERGVSVAPYLLITLFLGSLGPLLYLVRRPEENAVAVSRAPARA